MLRVFRKKYIDQNVYIYPCNGCKKYSMMYHLENCVICGMENRYYDNTYQVEDSLNGPIFEEVMNIAEVLGAPQFEPNTQE